MQDRVEVYEFSLPEGIRDRWIAQSEARKKGGIKSRSKPSLQM
jgi:hypothetical protein